MRGNRPFLLELRKMSRKSMHPAQRAFTLVELVSTLAVIGTLAAFAIPRFVGRTGFESRGFYDRAQSVVRYAQKVAIAQRQSAPKSPLYVVIGESDIRVCYDSGCTSAVTDAASGTALAIAAPRGVTLSPVTFTFDGRGTPSFGSRLGISVNSNEAGDVDRTFYVEAQTGYVHD
jgi:MSHA pilin protein MshC